MGDLGRQYVADIQLGHHTDHERINPSAVGIDQLGKVADSDHHFRIRVPLADLIEPVEKAAEAEVDRIKDRVHQVTGHPHAF